ncbi:interleukin-4 precursor [Capra hircus]|uniref:Interleukin-4 n=4 Tax=Caprinae TaxID=9963 RepID=IL4_CAPHI|nr:interleukin-4 precursor [Capra hircus]P79155.1 RecName: Full=Interleukin-4; Short=IL-4; AltName: Full=B-cell stimulatory factor 1; Short=BSF-1; AltName: Full=Lymphocyte stimulatory factor 1; Flags: Precursor [Capra hircus]AAB38526.1 interleukin-4 [Capra hircus]
MGLTSQLIPALVCLLVCTSHFVHGHKCDITLEEIIKMLNILTSQKNSCMELPVADVFAAPKNATEKETFCRAGIELRRIYRNHMCLNKFLGGLDRNLSSLASKTCSVNEAKTSTSTLRDLLERLKTIMKEKYSKC